MTPDQILKQLGREGWDGLNVDPAAHDAATQRMISAAEAEARPIAAALSTPEGQYLFNWLIKKTLFRSPSELETAAMSAEHYAILKAKREGQNSIIFMLLHVLQVANGQQPPGSDA